MSFRHRRSARGYAFETYMVKFFDITWKEQGWNARRLGGSSTGLPDVVVTNNKTGVLFSVEAKSTFQGEAYIKQDQIMRCSVVMDVFGYYPKKTIIFAFKFSKNKDKGRDKLQYYFFKVKSVSNLENIKWVKCFYDGRLRYKLLHPEKKSELKVIKYDKLLHLKDNIIVKPVTEYDESSKEEEEKKKKK